MRRCNLKLSKKLATLLATTMIAFSTLGLSINVGATQLDSTIVNVEMQSSLSEVAEQNKNNSTTDTTTQSTTEQTTETTQSTTDTSTQSTTTENSTSTNSNASDGNGLISESTLDSMQDGTNQYKDDQIDLLFSETLGETLDNNSKTTRTVVIIERFLQSKIAPVEQIIFYVLLAALGFQILVDAFAIGFPILRPILCNGVGSGMGGSANMGMNTQDGMGGYGGMGNSFGGMSGGYGMRGGYGNSGMGGMSGGYNGMNSGMNGGNSIANLASRLSRLQFISDGAVKAIQVSQCSQVNPQTGAVPSKWRVWMKEELIMFILVPIFALLAVNGSVILLAIRIGTKISAWLATLAL